MNIEIDKHCKKKIRLFHELNVGDIFYLKDGYYLKVWPAYFTRPQPLTLTNPITPVPTTCDTLGSNDIKFCNNNIKPVQVSGVKVDSNGNSTSNDTITGTITGVTTLSSTDGMPIQNTGTTGYCYYGSSYSYCYNAVNLRTNTLVTINKDEVISPVRAYLKVLEIE